MTKRGLLKGQIVFCGYYGRQNAGDDAFCAVASWGAQHYWNVTNVRFLCRHTPKLPGPGKPLLLRRSVFPGQGFLEAGLHAARGSTVVFAGGSIFGRSIPLLNRRRVMGWAHRAGRIELGAIGVSVGPYKHLSARRSLEKFLRRFSFLALRDRRSFEEACSMNLPFQPIQSSDLALLFPKVYGEIVPESSLEESRPVLGVNVCHYERYVGGETRNEQRRESLVLDTLRKVATAVPITIRLFVLNGNPHLGDAQLANLFAESLSNCARIEIVPYSDSPGATWRKVGQCDAFLGIRLHSGIFSFAARVPFLLVEYHRKCTDFLDDIGWPGKWRIGDFQVSADEAAEILTHMVTLREKSSVLDLEPFVAKAERNFTAVRKTSF